MASIIIKGRTKVPKGTMEDFDRPKHNDFATTEELKKDKFSGVRNNSITSCIEIWTVGDIRASVPNDDPDALSKAFEDIFGMSIMRIEKE